MAQKQKGGADAMIEAIMAMREWQWCDDNLYVKSLSPKNHVVEYVSSQTMSSCACTTKARPSYDNTLWSHAEKPF
jgi:hypothetical protein